MSPVLSSRSTSSALLDWLHEPSDERGISFAAAEDSWDRLSWRELAELAWRVAGGLIEDGVERGDRVALVAGATPAFVAGLFGALLAGAVPSPWPLPILFQSREHYETHLAGLLRAAAPARVLAAPHLEAQIGAVAAAVGVRMVPLAELCGAAALACARPPATLALVQFTSGSSGRPRPVPVAPAALDANIAAIRRWLGMTANDATASWLPVHHDMGLIGCLLTPAAVGSDLLLMAPEEFVRQPLRYLHCFDHGAARLSAMPGFGLEYILRRVPPEALSGLALGGWRTLIVGAERLHAAVLRRFERLLAPFGFSSCALAPAYGLAEAALAVTGLPVAERWRSVAIGPSPTLGKRVPTGECADSDRVVGCGRALSGVRVRIVGTEGVPVRDGALGEIVVDGACTPGPVATGDAGFLRDGELFVLGRLGDGLKLHGRFVFAEDIEADLVAAGLKPHRVAAILGHDRGRATAVALLEDSSGSAVSSATAVLRRRAAGAHLVVLPVPRGAIARTTSGKPRRRPLWRAFVQGQLTPTQPSDRTAPSTRGADA
ncbi:MAG: AMP-binding protein [Solirubrobacteraceae bacterium]